MAIWLANSLRVIFTCHSKMHPTTRTNALIQTIQKIAFLQLTFHINPTIQKIQHAIHKFIPFKFNHFHTVQFNTQFKYSITQSQFHNTFPNATYDLQQHSSINFPSGLKCITENSVKQIQPANFLTE